MAILKQNTHISTEKWVDDYGDFLFRFALLRIDNHNLAEDIVQDTFLSALKSVDSFKKKSSEKTWLLSILKHKIIDHYRKKKVLGDSISEGMEDESGDFLENGKWKPESVPQNWGNIPDNLYEQSEFSDTLQKCLCGIPLKPRTVFTMRAIDGVSSEIICKELSLTSSNLWVMMHRARGILRKCLEKNWFAL